ncbi:MAG: pyruvate dehydrogenase (acetyl-transferring), homodimeric type, partial [Gammaproteobacteria bacterium]|nr:pyruvate dehydrogenase (acetyl-transferring), homodimeric type [Gammaproteobacteria bacterium]
DADDLKWVRDRFNVPVSDEQIDSGEIPFLTFKKDSREYKYLMERRKQLGGHLPQRKPVDESLKIPDIDIFKQQLAGTGDREISTTMAFVRMLTALTRDKNMGKRVVPIVPDEARTFGMEGLFRQLGIYSDKGQLYEPQDADQLMFYKESKDGQILEEGITEAGSMSSWIAAATSYANHGLTMVPFYIFYSMFGFQRIHDLAWAAGDSRARGFLLGGTAGRTTLNGEGLQHEDGHSHVMSSVIPNCVSYDPTYSYEVATIVHDGLKRMYEKKEDVFYYLTVMNENYVHPDMPKGAEEGILKGLYKLKGSGKKKAKHTVQLMGSGTILREVEAAAEILEKDFDIAADVWSATSFTELRRDGMDADRHNMLNPTGKARESWVAKQFKKADGPFVAASDYMRIVAEQIRPWVPGTYITLGTDGYGRSDSRDSLRRHFEVNRHYVVVAALKALADDGEIDAKVVADAIKTFKIDAKRVNPWQA